VKYRSFLFVGIVLFVALLTWSASTMVGSAIAGGRDDFSAWRTEHAGLFVAIWAAEVLVVCVPLLWVIGRRLRAQETAHDKEVLLTRGMGRLTGEAMRGGEPATAKLIELLDDDEGVIRCQSARALVMVDKPESNEELFRKVSYWPGDQKSAMVDVLRRMKDPRARALMEVLANDRSRLVAGRARAALAATAGKTTDMTDTIARRKREAAAIEKRAAAKKKKMSRGAAARTAAAQPEPAPSAPAAAPQAPPVATKPPQGALADEAAEAGAAGMTEPLSP
jgi:hypothetical protein